MDIFKLHYVSTFKLDDKYLEDVVGTLVYSKSANLITLKNSWGKPHRANSVMDQWIKWISTSSHSFVTEPEDAASITTFHSQSGGAAGSWRSLPAGTAAATGVSWILAAYLSLPATSESQYAERRSVISLLKA